VLLYLLLVVTVGLLADHDCIATIGDLRVGIYEKCLLPKEHVQRKAKHDVLTESGSGYTSQTPEHINLLIRSATVMIWW
jgi:hypothetical protein